MDESVEKVLVSIFLGLSVGDHFLRTQSTITRNCWPLYKKKLWKADAESCPKMKNDAPAQVSKLAICDLEFELVESQLFFPTIMSLPNWK